MIDYKETLLLPKTDFPMRGNLSTNEPEEYKIWDQNKVYEQMKLNKKDKKIFTLHDGPPYANGNIHIGHALNKILKDFTVKYHYFNDYNVRFIPGWDCHGLPIEQQVEEKIGSEKKKVLPKNKLRQLCRDHATKFVDIQKNEFKSLGIISDWENPYLTMDFKFEANIYRELISIAKQKLLVQRSKPIYWSWSAKTALAEAEVEYKDKVSPSIYVAFKLKHQDASIIIWTTTPWTLPANSGISLHPEEKYILTTDNFIVAKKLYHELLQNRVVTGDIIKDIDPKSLENTYAINPLNDRNSKIILGDHVLMDSGTGAVHTAPGHGEDDYRIGLKYNLEVIMPVNENGSYDNTIVREKLLPNPENFLNVNVFKSNEAILNLLGNSLIKRTDITHSYPHCWRTHKPVIYRATKQWFISMDKPYGVKQNTLRQNALNAINEVNFYPEHGRNRLKSMLENRPDWCISRQRDWGVPIAFFRNKITDEIIFDEKVLNYIAMIFEVKGTDAWYNMSVQELLYPGSNLNPSDLEKTMDILDVWFDSGSTQYAVLRSRNYDAGSYPADIYLEGSDQHRGWFQSSLLVSLASNETIPYKSIITHGFTMDANGEKMSKSKKNVLAPNQVINQFGSEILRLWVAMSDYQDDQKISNDILKQISEQYRKIRNTLRFLLSNINDLNEMITIEKMGIIDKWILQKTYNIFNSINDDFKQYNFSRGLNKLNNFLVADLSNVYLDVCKDKLYCDNKTSQSRQASQSAMAMILKALIKILAPILTYTTNEVIKYSPQIILNGASSIFDFPLYELEKIDININETFLLEAKEKFNENTESLKKNKIIKSTLELVIYSNSKKFKNMTNTEIEDWFVVSKIIHHKEDSVLASFKIDDNLFEIYNAKKAKCPRCWKYRASKKDILCKRCEDVLDATKNV